MRIGLDVMGGDYAPEAIIEGAVDSLSLLSPDDRLVMIGDKAAIIRKMTEMKTDLSLVDIVHTTQVIEMGDVPSRAYQQKQDSSIAVGYRMLKDKEIQGFCSAGNTGAMMVGATYTVNGIPGVIRPALALIVPSVDHRHSVLLDVGLNPDTKPDVLCQYGLLGSIFAEYVLEIKNPSVRLLNIGEEEGKGTPALKTAYELMKDCKQINFEGNFEANHLFGEKMPDVIVCDGFVGNVIVKQTEALHHIFVLKDFRDPYFESLDPESIGGTPIVGINANVVVGHGVSKRKAVMNMILQTWAVVHADLAGKINDVI